MNILQLINCIKTGGAEKLLLDIIEHNQLESMFLYAINKAESPSLTGRIADKASGIREFGKSEGDRSFVSIIRVVCDIRSFCRKNRIHLIHVHNESTFLYSLMVKFTMPRIKIVYTVHDVNILGHSFNLFIKLLRFSKATLITISKAVYAEAAALLPSSRLRLVYNAINIKDYSLPKIPHDGTNLCCIARIIPEKKGQDILLRALSRLREKTTDFHCYLAGDVVSENSIRPKIIMDELMKIVEDGNLGECVTFCGNIPNIPEFLQKMDVLVLPSRYEGFGLVILEAMASGSLVIASRIDGPKELITDGLNGRLFECGNSDDLADKIHEAMTGRTDEMIRNARACVEQYDIGSMISEYVDIYRDVYGK